MYKSACLDSTHPWLIISIELFLALGNFLAPSTMTMPLEYNLYHPLSIENLNAPSFHSEFKCPSFNSQFKCSINISCSSKFSCSINYGKNGYLILVFLSKKKADWLVQNVQMYKMYIQVSLHWFNMSMVESCTSRNVLLELDPSSCVWRSCSTRARGKVSIWCSCSTRARASLARARPVLVT